MAVVLANSVELFLFLKTTLEPAFHRLFCGDTVDGSEIPAPVEVGSLCHYLQGFIHPSWCRISEPSTVWSISFNPKWNNAYRQL